MPPTTTSCCAVTLNQQQQTNISHCKHIAEQASASSNPNKPKLCTVVENGRVVVKAIAQD